MPKHGPAPVSPLRIGVALSPFLLAPALSGQAENAPVRQKVVIVGASVSAGFADPTSKGADGKVNRTFRLDVAFRKAWPQDLARIYNFGDMMMFQDPEQRGGRQIEAARKREPDLLIAIDFLTWFGYGARRGRPGADGVDPVRLAQLDKGLKLLEDFRCPMLLGDFPDMSGASSHMLPKSMIPDSATLAALNARLRKWAEPRRNVRLFPIAQFVAEAVSKSQVYPWSDDRKVTLPKNFLLQSDRLHATRVGTLVVVLRSCEALRDLLREDHPLRAPPVTFRSLVESAGLTEAIPQPKL